MNTQSNLQDSIPTATVQDLGMICDTLKTLPPDVRIKLQYIIEGAKLVNAAAAEDNRPGGAA